MAGELCSILCHLSFCLDVNTDIVFSYNRLGWGISLICSAAAHNFTNLLIGRIFLGGFEATLAPTFIALCQMWWRRREQTWRYVLSIAESKNEDGTEKTEKNDPDRVFFLALRFQSYRLEHLQLFGG